MTVQQAIRVGENAPMTQQDRSTAQTLSRGLQILELLAEQGAALTAQEIADELSLSRPIVYRLLRTLEGHGLLDGGVPEGRFAVGLGLLTLARRVVRDLREAALPEVTALSRAHATTAFIGVKEGQELVCVASAESESQLLAIRHREGMRLPLAGASGIAIYSTEPPSPTEPAEVGLARQRGYATSEGHIFPGAFGVAAPIVRRGERADAAIALIFSTEPDDEGLEAASRDVVEAARRISHRSTM